MWGYLPLEIFECILHELPLKTLIVCTSVCKEWKSLITDPSFISNHIDHTIRANNGNQDLLLQLRPFTFSRFGGSFFHHLVNEQLDFLSKVLSKVDYPLHHICHAPCLQVVGTCNGLVCLYNLCIGFLIWNPSIRKYTVLPELIIDTHNGALVKSFGFGFDSKNNDFKVVSFVSHRLNEPSSPQVQVYSLAARCWKSFTGSKAPLFILNRLVNSNQMFMNGVLHWAVMRNQTHENFIMTYNLVEETFGEIMLPESLRGTGINVSILGGGNLLTVINTPFVASFRDEYFDVWVMKEYGIVESWTKVHTGFTSQSRPLGFRKSSRDLLLHRHGSQEIIAVNEENIESGKKVSIKGIGHASLSYYVESLFLLDKNTDDVISY